LCCLNRGSQKLYLVVVSVATISTNTIAYFFLFAFAFIFARKTFLLAAIALVLAFI
jgi:hypothetical protein